MGIGADALWYQMETCGSRRRCNVADDVLIVHAVQLLLRAILPYVQVSGEAFNLNFDHRGQPERRNHLPPVYMGCRLLELGGSRIARHFARVLTVSALVFAHLQPIILVQWIGPRDIAAQRNALFIRGSRVGVVTDVLVASSCPNCASIYQL